jgi:Na+-transporting NADH:ubiquinone oxidoreductase subunit F
MAKKKAPEKVGDYSLIGKDSVLAVEKGLAEAAWYASPVPRARMRELLERRDQPAIRDTVLWFVLLFLFGLGGCLLWGTWWAVLFFGVYGVLYASVSDSRWHESSHGTAFKTDWMNNALYEIASFMVRRESIPWRWSHTRHHSDTIIVGRDPEIAVPRPANLRAICLLFFNLAVAVKYVRTVGLHCTGRITPDEQTYIPETEYSKVFTRARIYVLIYVGVIGLSILTRSFLPLMLFILPNFYGTWLTVIYGLTQHAGLAENVLDHRLNCRTVYMDWLHRYLYWNMGYHVEHHMFPLVPYHALPKLHELIKADCPPAYNGLIEAYREIIPALRRQAQDPYYYVQRQLPAPTARATETDVSHLIKSNGKPVQDGWIEICDSSLLLIEDVLRFDHGNQTFAVYRAHDGKYYATDGICTHGNAHLADGFVKGNLIECTKHNGRFDLRDGSPQRLPVCVGLKTYAVREDYEKLYLDLNSPAGYGVTAPVTTYSFQVVSNDNVATFIKELVLEPDPESAPFHYQPGDYIQIEIPAYTTRSLHEVEIRPPYAQVWEVNKVFEYQASNPFPCRRNYSLASEPTTDKFLRFNVRLATPPYGSVYNSGTGSSYIFCLKPGDTVTALGPFGEFHTRQTDREMVYLGGGAGMAPLRSHLSHLLEVQKTSARISFWYGARSRQELFYQEYFSDLANRHENFTFHVALSDPQPGDQWNSHTGFIHEVLKREYLDSHPNPRQIDFFLCGPPAMIQAATVMLKNLGVPAAQILYDEF